MRTWGPARRRRRALAFLLAAAVLAGALGWRLRFSPERLLRDAENSQALTGMELVTVIDDPARPEGFPRVRLLLAANGRAVMVTAARFQFPYGWRAEVSAVGTEDCCVLTEYPAARPSADPWRLAAHVFVLTGDQAARTAEVSFLPGPADAVLTAVQGSGNRRWAFVSAELSEDWNDGAEVRLLDGAGQVLWEGTCESRNWGLDLIDR